MSEAQYLFPDAIVTTDWLDANLDDPSLRIYDCTTYLHYEEGTGRPYRVESGQADWETGHIPGSAYLDLQSAFSDDAAPTRFMRLTPEATAEAFARHGVGTGTRVILYARNGAQWATRFWWMLRWIGFDNAALLDGGWDKWVAEGRAVSTGDARYPAGQLEAHPRPELFTEKEDVLGAIGAQGTCTLNALTADLHEGSSARYGRPGRIPGSTNIPASTLVDPETKELLPAARVQEMFASAGATPEGRVINYCGGGIAATLDAFLQVQLGFRDITVYDASMSEWARDESLPIESG